jgi:GWxTD domain-containing protein
MTDNLIGVRSLGIIFTDESSGREIRKLHLFFPPAAQDREDVYIVNDMPVSGGSDQFQLTNLDGVIPYSARNYSLIISSSQTFRSVPSFEFRGFDSVFVKTPDRIVTGELLMEQSNEKIQLSLDTNKRGKTYFIFYNISNVLFPGTYQCQMQKGIDSCSEKNLSLRVAWLDAPMTFLHPLSAAKMLQLVDELIDKSYLNDIDSSQTALFKFWKKYDPTAATSFNELMAEFYRRGDYAMEHFSTLKGNDGIETDRGKIYIKYGKPSQIRRDMNSQNKVIEIWIYKNGITYYLVDKTGTGDFELVGAP